MLLTGVFFFFSSRRRHTRFDCDWSSDVCSSDLRERAAARRPDPRRHRQARDDRAGRRRSAQARRELTLSARGPFWGRAHRAVRRRSEEHTSELQSQSNLVCRLLLEKKKTTEHESQSNHVCPLLLEKKQNRAPHAVLITLQRLQNDRARTHAHLHP